LRRDMKTTSNSTSPSSSQSWCGVPSSIASSTSYVSSSRNGRSDAWVCSRSHGQPSGARSARMISTSFSKRSPTPEVMPDMLPFDVCRPGGRRAQETMAENPEGPEGSGSHEHDASAVTFVGFVLSLAHTAAFHFGDVPDPATGKNGEPNIAAARQLID